ncbi:MAG: site-specific DNA-methyltransferase [Thaumarchaeota archaeon]|nr:site-specific DNA-methyltransferase [Nitrososphaerota archaeon]
MDNLAKHAVIIGDSRKMSELASGSIQVCVTSPPYFRNKKYETQYSTYPEYRRYLIGIWKEVNRVLADSGLLFVNIGNSFDNQFKSHEVARDVVDLGFHFVQPVIWVKGHHSPVQGETHLNHLYEHIFIFSKTEGYSLNRLAIGVPYKDKSNIGRWKIAKQDLRCRGDVWHINYETVQKHSEKMHDAIFPKMLPEMCIKLASKRKSDRILDPFLGSGTTILAASELGRKSIGYEINPSYEKIIRKKLNGVEELRFIRNS